MGEDVVYEVLDHIANRDLGPRFDLTGPKTLGELCALLGELDLFEGSPPEREPSRHYRRWAFESAALDLALRQNGLSLHEAVGRDPKPVRFVCSTRLTSFGDETASSTHAITSRLERYPGLEFKLDPENDWTPELIEEIAEVATVQVMDLKGYYKGTVVEVETDPELYRAVAEKFPEAWLEDPDLTDATREVLKPHWDRLTYDAPLHSLEDVKTLAPERAINSKPSRFGSLEELLAIYAYCEEQRPPGVRRRPGRGRARPRSDPVPGVALPPRHPERHRARGLQRPGGARGNADEPDGPGARPRPAFAGASPCRPARGSASPSAFARAFFHAFALPRPDIRLKV